MRTRTLRTTRRGPRSEARRRGRFGHEVVHQAPAEGYVCQGEPVAKSPQPVATLEQSATSQVGRPYKKRLI